MKVAILAFNLPRLQKQIDRLARKARKINYPEIPTLVVGEAFSNFQKVGGKEYKIEMVNVEVTGTEPKINGFEFVATLQHTEEGNIIRAVPGNEGMDFTPYRDAGRFCDHCKQTRNRIDTYLIRETATGALKQVGSSCLRDFLGCASPEYFAELAQFDLRDFYEDMEGGGGTRRELMMRTERFLARVAYWTRVEGFRSRKYAEKSGGTTSSTRAWYWPKDKEDQDATNPNEVDEALAKNAREWAEELETQDDFKYNLSLVAKREYLSLRETGICAYIVEAYRKEVEHLEYEKKERLESCWIGIVGERKDMELTYLKCWAFDSMYGLCYIYKFSQNGNIVIWKTGKGYEFEAGKSYTLKATVKAHDTHKDIKQTVITRAKTSAPLMKIY